MEFLCHKLDYKGKIIKSFYFDIDKTTNPQKINILFNKVKSYYNLKGYDDYFIIKYNEFFYFIGNNKYIKNNIVEIK